MGICCGKSEDPTEEDTEVNLQHFHLLKSVGKGAFGKVRVVRHAKSNIIYALKYINKAQCIRMKAVENIIQERKLLEEIECPFVVNLRYAFQDDENMFMVIELMLGGDLRFHLERMGKIKEELVQFYVAEISCGLAFLHSKKVVHRDLKPDNVLLDEKGHVHLTDFNIAVHYREDKPLTAVAGSMAYMAPEILARKGYLSTIDWWSLGVMMYEFLFGNRPFRGKTNEMLTEAILHDELYIPSKADQLLTPDCLDCMKKFLVRDITQRLGVKEMGGLQGIQKHPFFKNINWPVLEKKEAIPPFVPSAQKANFDATHELEELLLEDNPLKNKTKKKGKDEQKKVYDDPAVEKAMQIMAERFTVYDFVAPKKPAQPEEQKPEKSLLSPNGHSIDGTTSTSGSSFGDIMEGREDEVDCIGLESSRTTSSP